MRKDVDGTKYYCFNPVMMGGIVMVRKRVDEIEVEYRENEETLRRMFQQFGFDIDAGDVLQVPQCIVDEGLTLEYIPKKYKDNVVVGKYPEGDKFVFIEKSENN